MRYKWSKVIGLFLLGFLLIVTGFFFAYVAHVVLGGIFRPSVVTKVVNEELTPFVLGGAIIVALSILLAKYASPN